ncbi:MAG: YgjV family protein [Acutalibacteraceae bacterium]|nr:YgjV family protein [Acutalibacteraceae bacterium]
MEIIANIIGIIAVAVFLLSYQMKKRNAIVTCNVISRVLYIVQYILLGAFEGAVLDIVGVIASLVAQKKDKPFIKKYMLLCFIAVDLLTIGAGILLYENVYSILPIIGVLLHTGAFWLNDEKRIRQVSLAGSPFWFVYNFHSRAYGSSVGDLLSMVSIILAMFRYDFKRKKV